MAAGDRPCIEMGSRRTHEEAAVASARAAYVAGFEATSNLAARQRYGVPDRRHRRRTASRCSTTPRRTRSAPRSTSLGKRHHAAGRHLRRRRGGPARRRGRRPRARRGAARLRRPGRAGPPGARPARRARRQGHPDRGDQRPRRVRHRRARRRPGRRLRRRHRAGHRLRTPDLRLRLQAGLARGRGRRDGVGGEEEQGQDLDRRPEVRAAAAQPRAVSRRPR